MASYLLSYDYLSTFSIQEQLLAFVKANRHIIQWSQPYLGLFLLKSDTDLQTLAVGFREFFSGKSHIIVLIEGGSAQGIMPTYVWDWMNQPQPSALSGLLGSAVFAPK